MSQGSLRPPPPPRAPLRAQVGAAGRVSPGRPSPVTCQCCPPRWRTGMAQPLWWWRLASPPALSLSLPTCKVVSRPWRAGIECNQAGALGQLPRAGSVVVMVGCVPAGGGTLTVGASAAPGCTWGPAVLGFPGLTGLCVSCGRFESRSGPPGALCALHARPSWQWGAWPWALLPPGSFCAEPVGPWAVVGFGPLVPKGE